MSIIEVSALAKTFKTRERAPGLAGSLRSFVTPQYRQREAVKPISFSLERGEVLAFIGPNGAGKSTTIKMLTGILYPCERLVRMLFNGVVAIAMALILVGPPQFSLIGLFAWPLVTFLALCIDFVAYFSIGLLAFWTENTDSFTFVFSRLTLVLGGVLAPLEIFPQPLRSIAQALPFSAILYGPARTLVHFELDRFGWLLLQQALTLGVGCLILLVIYGIAIRRVNINGG